MQSFYNNNVFRRGDIGVGIISKSKDERGNGFAKVGERIDS